MKRRQSRASAILMAAGLAFVAAAPPGAAGPAPDNSVREAPRTSNGEKAPASNARSVNRVTQNFVGNLPLGLMPRRSEPIWIGYPRDSGYRPRPCGRSR